MDNSKNFLAIIEGIFTLLLLGVGIGLILTGHFRDSAKYLSDFGIAFLVVGVYLGLRALKKVIIQKINKM